MITNEITKLLEVWRDDLFAEFSIIEIMHRAKKKTKPWVFNALKLLAERNVLMMRTKGNINLYRLHLSNPLAVQMLHHVEVQGSLNFPRMDVVSDIMENVPVENYCLIVFGSHAEHKQKPSSDLDVCFLVSDKQMEKRMRPYVNEVKLNHAVSIDEHYVTFDDFIDMLLRKEENLGKQIVKKHLLFFNADIYYQLLKKAHRHGFVS